MGTPTEGTREGSLEAPKREPLEWEKASFYDKDALFKELERIFDICHGCRRCVSLCQAFPTLFDLVDESPTMEVDGVKKEDYWKVVDHCYLCDLCFMTKCPYVPPHPWNVDFPHLMLRAKAVNFKDGKTRVRDRVLTSTDVVGRLAGIPVIAQAVNTANRTPVFRKALDKVLGVHPEAKLPEFHGRPFRSRYDRAAAEGEAIAAGPTRGRVALFATCYGNRNAPQINDDLVAVFRHNGIPVTVVEKERCCGMPKFELGDLASVAAGKETNIPQLSRLIDEGWDIVAAIPSCALMFKQELPLMFPGDADVEKVRRGTFDPFEYLALRHKHGQLKTDFVNTLGKIAYHVPCHLRVQNIGLKTREVLSLVPDTQVETIERCSGHDGTYAVKSEFHAASMKIARPVVERVRATQCDHYGSDCPMAGDQIDNGLRSGMAPEHPLTLLRRAYGI
jgi:Fe-S oxidoreductase